MDSAQKSDTFLNPPNLEQILPGLKFLSSLKNTVSNQVSNQIETSKVENTTYNQEITTDSNSHSTNPHNHHVYQDFEPDCRKKLKNRESAQAARDRRKNRVVFSHRFF